MLLLPLYVYTRHSGNSLSLKIFSHITTDKNPQRLSILLRAKVKIITMAYTTLGHLSHISDLSYGGSSLCHSAPYILAFLLFLRQSKRASTSQLLSPAVPFAGNALPPDSQMFVSLFFFRSLLKRNSITGNFLSHLIHIKATSPPTFPEPLTVLYSSSQHVPHLHGT